MIKKIFSFVITVALLLSLTGCESEDVKKAKGYIDKIYSYTHDASADKAEYLATGSAAKKKSAEFKEKQADEAIEWLAKLYAELSEKERQQVDDYHDEVIGYYMSLG